MCKRKRKENPGAQTSDYHRNEYYHQKSFSDLVLLEIERAYQKDEYPVDDVEHIPRHQFSGCKNLKVGLAVHSREYIVEFTGSRGHRLNDAVAGHRVQEADQGVCGKGYDRVGERSKDAYIDNH